MFVCCAMQVQQAKDSLSEARHDAQKNQDALTTCQLLLAEASSSQQELQSQCSDLQLQAQESAAQSSSSQSALAASQDRLAASESDLAKTRSHVSVAAFVLITKCPIAVKHHVWPNFLCMYLVPALAWLLLQFDQGCTHCA